MIKRTIRALLNIVYLSLSIRRNVKFHRDLSVRFGTYITAPTELSIGRQVSIGSYCFIACNGTIGDGVLISSYVGIVGRLDHDMSVIGTYIRNAPWIYNQDLNIEDRDYRVDIGADVWIGYGATILSGVTIGRGAVVGAAATVTKDVPPYAIVVGVPAQQVGMRFSESEIRAHETELTRVYGAAETRP